MKGPWRRNFIVQVRAEEGVMLYDVRVLDPNMRITEIINARELTRKFWQDFYQGEKDKSFTKTSDEKIPQALRKKLEAQFPELYDLSYFNRG